MEILFRCLVVVAIALGIVALVGRPAAPEISPSERDPDDVRRIAALENRIRTLESRGVAPAPEDGPHDGAEAAMSSTEIPEETALDAAIDRRLDQRLPGFREKLVADFRLDETASGLSVIADAKPKTLEEIGEKIGLNGNEIDFIRDEREAMQREIMGIFKEDGESDEAFETRMRALAEDPEAQAEATQKMMTKMMSEGGLAKMLTIRAKHDKVIRERIGDERYRKYKTMEGGLEGGGSMSLGIRMSTEATDEDR